MFGYCFPKVIHVHAFSHKLIIPGLSSEMFALLDSCTVQPLIVILFVRLLMIFCSPLSTSDDFSFVSMILDFSICVCFIHHCDI